MNVPDPRRDPRIVRVAQVVVVLLLLAVAVFAGRLSTERDENAGQAEAVQSVLAQTCSEVPFADLQAQGLVAECIAAQEGSLTDDLPAEAVADPAMVADDPNVLPDDDNATATDIGNDGQPGTDGTDGTDGQDATDEQVDAGLRRYFASNPLPTDAEYARLIQRNVTAYFTANPPQAPPLTEEQIRPVVRDALIANPPPAGPAGVNGTNGTDGQDGADGQPGTDGADGRGVAATSLDGCDVVFTYTDGTTDRIGPLCGPPGPPGTTTAIDECDPPDGDVVIDTDLSYDPERDAMVLTCDSRPGGLLGP